MPSNAHCRRIDSAPSLHHDELADLGVETSDLPLAVAHDIAIPGL
jgi:hypothetical protein